ncbi:MAG: ParA family protein [Candidatus Kariarchaeaceae archaeon]|jgi:MinD-like ATPase involved in chromosome partitioning or flagellar assembly
MKIILTHSYKGGSGKTLFSLNVANILTSEFGKRVLLIESDFPMAAFQSIFTQYKPDIFFNDFLNSAEEDLSRYIYPNIEDKLGIIFCDNKLRAKDKVQGNDQNWFLRKRQQINLAISKLNYDFVIFDITPGMHFFAVNILSIANEVFLLARPDVQNLHGISILLDRLYSRTVQLTSNDQFRIRLMFNQIPIYEPINPILNDWSDGLLTKYKFIDNVHRFYYEPETSYNTTIEKFILPTNDPNYERIKEFVSKILIID